MKKQNQDKPENTKNSLPSENVVIGSVESDKNLLFVKTVLLVLNIIGYVLALAGGFYFWENSVTVVGTNNLYVALGFIVSIFGILINILLYKIALFMLWVSYDIKLIRNKLYNLPDTEYLEKFIGIEEK